MCSNNTNNNVGVRGVANASGVLGDHDHHESSGSRKAKKQRIPKRGPGVAELEKILREQEKRDGVENGKLIGENPSLTNTYPPPHSSFVSSSNSLSRNVTLHNHLGKTTHTTPLPCPPVMTLHGNGDLKGSSLLGWGSVDGNGRSKGVYIGGSGVFLPERALLPIMWGSSETRKDQETPKMATDFSFPILVSDGSDNHVPCHPSMVNLLPRSATSSSSIPPPSSSPRMFHHVEPPSNQKSCHNYISSLPEEDKMIGPKRPRPSFPVDNWLPALPRMHCQRPPFQPHISSLDPSSSSSNHGLFNLGTASRNQMTSSPLELKATTCVNYHGKNPSSLTLGSPTTPLPSTQNCQPDMIPKFIKQFPFQDMKENTKGIPQSSSSGSEASLVHNKSFFSFLLPSEEEQNGAAEATLGLKNEKHSTEKTGDSIDLNLKL